MILEREKQQTASHEWWKDFYAGEDYLRIYTPFLSAERTAREVESMIRLLNVPIKSSILDLCCGNGRHAISLAQRGYQVTGQDLSDTLLQCAKTEAEAQRVQVDWVLEDMRTIPFEGTFDVVIDMFTSFGTLESESEDLQVLQQVHKALKSGGFFLLETVYQPCVIRAFTPYGVTCYNDGMIVLEKRHIDLRTSRNEIHITMLSPDGKRTEHDMSMRLYTLTELMQMLATAGLPVLAYYGGLDGSPLTMDSRLVVLSQKKG